MNIGDSGAAVRCIYEAPGHVDAMPVDGDVTCTGRVMERHGDRFVQVQYKLLGQADKAHVYHSYFLQEELELI